ncbi:hypothetical protein BDF14DRAFT_1723471 [Spinellus fusiger]|nr:hypothetical protein BDF14DRAFT_1723471 [Spinellus fusiger]
MHLRFINTQDIIHGKPMQHKLAVIPPIIRDFPNRKFILVGDSGEFDPEVYQEIYRQFPDQIIKIFIHDVSSERAMNADKTREASASEKYYTILRKFVTREHSLLKRTNTSPQTAMDAITDTEVPQEQKIAMDPNVSENTKLEIFEERMKRVSTGMREGVFHVFKFASQLLLVSRHWRVGLYFMHF